MSKIAGFDVTEGLAAAQQKQSTLRGQGQQQQWLLMLEKAYLTLQQGNPDADNAPADKNAQQVQREDKPSPPSAATEPLSGRARKVTAEETSPAAPDNTNETRAGTVAIDDVRLGSAAVTKFNLSAEPLRMPLSPGLSGNTASTAERLTARLNAVLPGDIPELKSATLMKGAEGLHLSVRDLQAGDLKQFVDRIRRLFADLNLPLARITVNGKTAWQQHDPPDPGGDGGSHSTVNKIY